MNVIPGKKQTSPLILYATIAAALTFLLTGLIFFQNSDLIIAYILSVNLATLLFYGYDKRIAGSGRLRVPEWILHGLAFFGGSPAALVAQKLFRHKTIKGSFQLVYWAIVALQVIILIIIQYYN